jgi:hypothetical protein
VFRIRGSRAFPDDQLRRGSIFRRIISKTLEPLKKNSRGACSDLTQRLANSSQTGRVVVGKLDIIKSDDGYILRHR